LKIVQSRLREGVDHQCEVSGALVYDVIVAARDKTAIKGEEERKGRKKRKNGEGLAGKR